VLALFQLEENNKVYVTYRPLLQQQPQLRRYWGYWSDSMEVLEISSIGSLMDVGVVGIWKRDERVHVLQKHPGILFLDSDSDIGDNIGDKD
jgi:hypothetical protein